MRIKVLPPKLLWLFVMVLLALMLWVYQHYQEKLDCIQQDMQQIETR